MNAKTRMLREMVMVVLVDVNEKAMFRKLIIYTSLHEKAPKGL